MSINGVVHIGFEVTVQKEIDQVLHIFHIVDIILLLSYHRKLSE